MLNCCVQPCARPAAGVAAVPRGRARSAARPRCQPLAASLRALLFDCDGVILESEELHRRAYNAVFAHHAVTVDDVAVNWSETHYDMLSNTVGGGKPKMRCASQPASRPTDVVRSMLQTSQVALQQARLADQLHAASRPCGAGEGQRRPD